MLAIDVLCYMKLRLALFNKNKSFFKTLLVIYSLSFLILTGVGLQKKVNVFYLVGDPATITGQKFYLGALSNLGILGWCISAGICFFCAALIKYRPYERETYSFFLGSGLISAVFLFDDLFLIHEKIFPDYLLIPQKLLLLAYGLSMILFFWKFRRKVINRNLLLITLAFAFFALSVSLDMRFIPLPESIAESSLRSLMENGSKFLGIVSWSLYFVSVGFQSISTMLSENNRYSNLG